MAGRREDLVSSFRLAVTEEARLFGAGLLALVGYALWVGLSGAALTFGADALNVPLSADPWTGAKTGLAAVALLAWVVVPAAVAAWLLVGQLTNESGNIAQRYRYRYPGVLLAPPAVLLVVTLAATVALDGPPWPAFVVLVFAGLFLLVRTVAYGYRVFSLSAPRALAAAAGLSFLTLSLALLTGGATLAGRRAYLVAVTDGFAGSLGVTSAVWLADGRVTVAGATLPAAVAVAVAVPVGLSFLYLLVQTLAGGVNRVRAPDVPRSELRTGQRYPDFARPTTTPTGGAGGSSSAGASTPSKNATGSSASGSGVGSASGTGPTPGSGSASGTSSTKGSASSAASSGPPGSSPDSASGPGSSSEESAAAGDGGGSDDVPTVDTGPAEPQMTDDVSNTRVYTPPDEGEGDGDDPLSFEADPGEEGDGADTEVSPAGSGGAETSDAAGATGDDVCPECGESHDSGAVFCPACGAALE